MGVAVASRDEDPDATASAARGSAASRPRYLPGLDGLRGLAVAAVVAYHLGFGWARGGYLGVDTFLVLSGYLITTGLVWEHSARGRIGLRHFWVRRAQRLLPALLVLLAAAGIYAATVALPDEAHSLRLDALTALGFFSNWRFVLTGQGYFAESAAPSLLRHTWSLAVEGQLYLLWPLVVLAILSRKGARRLAAVAAGLAAASGGLGIVLVAAGSGVTRAYYGTDTRAVSFLVGAALAAAVAARSESAPAGHGVRPAGWVLGSVAGAGLILTFGLWATVSGTSSALWWGVLPLAGVATAAVIAEVVLHPAGRLSRALSITPLRRLGAVSYGVYLWHWPLIILLNNQRTGLSALPLLAVRLGATAVATTASWLLVERPILRWKPISRRRTPRLAASAEAPVGEMRERRRLTRVSVRAGRRDATNLPLAAANSRLGASGTSRCDKPALRSPALVAAGVVALSVGLVIALVVVPAGQARSATVAGFSAQLGPATPARPLAAAAAAGTVPAVMFGDSVAVTLAAGMAPVAASYHVELANAAEIGCGVALGNEVRSLGHVAPVPNVCANWTADWQRWVDVARPAVSIILLGRWELLDRRIGSRWEHIGDTAFDDYVATQLDTAIAIAGSSGGRVVICTAPFFRGVERPEGGSWPENAPSRVQRFNQLVRAAVARHPQAVLFDLNALVSPGGRFASVIGGRAVRSDDGVHFSPGGGAYVAGPLLGLVSALRRAGQ